MRKTRRHLIEKKTMISMIKWILFAIFIFLNAFASDKVIFVYLTILSLDNHKYFMKNIFQEFIFKQNLIRYLQKKTQNCAILKSHNFFKNLIFKKRKKFLQIRN